MTTKQIRDILVNAHKNTSQVRRFRVVILSTNYEMFKIKSAEALQNMIIGFIFIMNKLVFLGVNT